MTFKMAIALKDLKATITSKDEGGYDVDVRFEAEDRFAAVAEIVDLRGRRDIEVYTDPEEGTRGLRVGGVTLEDSIDGHMIETIIDALEDLT